MARIPAIRLSRARDPEYEARRLKRRFAAVSRRYELAVSRGRRLRRAGWIAAVALAAAGSFVISGWLLSIHASLLR